MRTAPDPSTWIRIVAVPSTALIVIGGRSGIRRYARADQRGDVRRRIQGQAWLGPGVGLTMRV